MISIVWGPPLWKALFVAARFSSRQDVLEHLLLDVLRYILPCDKCCENYVTHLPRVKRRAKGRDNVYWLFCMKDEVNKLLNVPSIKHEQLLMRLDFHGPVVDEAEFCDVVCVMAIKAEARGRSEEFVEFCHAMAEMLPFPSDSQTRALLAAVQPRTAITGAVRAAQAARVERGFPKKTRAQYVGDAN